MATDPVRRLEPVVRLAPAKVNLTLAVLGTRPDGFHDLHSVMVPLDLADRLSVAVAATGRRRHAPRRRLRPRTRRRQPRPAGDRRGPPRRAAGVGPPGAAAAPRRPPREADPRRGRAGRRLLGRGRGGRRCARGLGRDASIRRHAFGSRRSWARTCRSSWPVARRWSRGAESASPRWPGCGTRDPAHDRPGLLLVTPSCGISTPAVFRAWDEGARVAGGAARMASMHLAEELRNGRLRVADLLARASVAGGGQRPGARGDGRGARPRALQAGAAAAPRPGRSASPAPGPPTGRSILRMPRRPRPPTSSARRSPPATCPHRARTSRS